MRVLVVGGGGREHALAWAVSRSERCSELICAPGNAGTARLGENLAVAANDIEGIVRAALQRRIDLVVVGPEDPLARGLVDALRAAGVQAFGPTAAAARIESSKWFAKQVMSSAGAPHAPGERFDSARAAHKWIEMLGPEALPVVKADGLAAGKGVVVPATIDAAHAAVDELLGVSAQLVLEDRLSGREVSAMAIVKDGTLWPLPLSCDYKRIGDGGSGPNTGGMGVYSPPGFVADPAALFEQLHGPVAAEMAARGSPFEGCLYGGVMVEGDQARVFEFNCRFGDPEAQALFPLLDGDLLNVLAGDLTAPPAFRAEASVAVVMASGGYPGAYQTGARIFGLDDVDEDVTVFHAGTALDEGGAAVTSGGRVLAVAATAPTLAAARARAYENVERIHFEGAYWRTDIALRELGEASGTGAAKLAVCGGQREASNG